MSIVRAPRPTSNYYVLDKRISEDKHLSWAARGVLIFLLGKPDSWQVSIANLINETAGSVKQSRRDAVYGLLQELIRAGYMCHKQANRADGKFEAIDYVVSELPLTEIPYAAPLPDLPDTAEPLPANPQQASTDVNQELKEENKDGGKAAPAARLPAARRSKAQTFTQWTDSVDVDGSDGLEDYEPLNRFIAKTGVPWEFEGLAWRAFANRYRHDPQYSSKTYIDWRRTYLNSLNGNWFRLWRVDNASNSFVLTTEGVMAKKMQK